MQDRSAHCERSSLTYPGVLLTTCHCLAETRTPQTHPMTSLSVSVELFGGILLVLIVAILYEGLKTFREILDSRGAKKAESETNINAGSEKEPLVTHAG